MITAEEFVGLFGKEKKSNNVRFGIITDAIGRPRVRLDGETTASIKRYPRLASYTPTAGDRVQIIAGVIQGKIV